VLRRSNRSRLFGKFLFRVRISFGPFAFDRQSRLLWRDGAEVALPPRVLGVLEVLIDRPGQVVARQDLLDGVWKDAFVTDTSLAEAVSFLRQALGDDPQAPRYIQTVHRRGYRFLPPVTEVAPRGLTPTEPPDGALRGLTPDLHFAVASGDRAVSATVKPSIAWELLPWSVAVLCAALATAAVWRAVSQPAPEAPPVARFDVQPVDGTAFDRRGPAVAVSADGRTLAWSACDATSGTCALYVRPVERLDAVRLAGSDGAASPFFAPDGRWIGFFADGKLKKIAASGGSASIVADAPSPGGGTWMADGRIVFAGTPAGGLSVVGDQGGAVTSLTSTRPERGEVRHLHPSWLPDGNSLVFTIASSPLADAPGEAAVLSLRANGWKTLRAGVTRAAPAGPGYLLFSTGGDLQAATFDERTLTLTGGSDSVLASVTGGDGISQFAISAGGTLAAVRSPKSGRVAWSDRLDSDAGAVARLTSVAISPDSRRAAGVIADGNGSDIWIADLVSGGLSRVTYGGTNVSPAWSADGRRVFFATRGTGPFGIAARDINNRGDVQPIGRPATHLFPSSVTQDGRIAATTVLPGGRTAVAIVPAGGGAPAIFNDGPFDEASPAFSQDGRWLAIESDESGRTEVFIRELPDGRRFAVSTDGGSRPLWSADGRFIFFQSGARLMRAAFDTAREPHVQKPEALVDVPGAHLVAVAPSGRALVEHRLPGSDRAVIVLQWLRELRQRLPLPVTAPR
jgi:DNA-binding winged helix-turn-helix (wHTH) protein/Tol biopolymer transport system component